MGIYCEHFFPWLMEKIGDAPKEVMGRLRRETLTGIHGKVLDIGFGIGFNMLYYPQSVTSVTALDISENMNKRAARFVSDSPIPVIFVKRKAEKMPFDNGEFDAVVSTMTLCTVDDIRATLNEIKRVLKQDGRFFFLEHVAAPKKRTGVYRTY